MTVNAPAAKAASAEVWDKTFALDDRVSHEKVRFTNRFGIELAADLYRPKNLTGKLPAIAVSGPFGAVKEQSSGLYARSSRSAVSLPSPLIRPSRARAAALRATSRRPTSTPRTFPPPSTICRFATTWTRT